MLSSKAPRDEDVHYHAQAGDLCRARKHSSDNRSLFGSHFNSFRKVSTDRVKKDQLENFESLAAIDDLEEIEEDNEKILFDLVAASRSADDIRSINCFSSAASHCTSRSKLQNYQMHANIAIMKVFPLDVAQSMLCGTEIFPTSKDSVSLFFSRVLDFHKLNENLTDDKISDMLERLYCKFDILARYYEVEVVDNIGETYLAATNLNIDQEVDHAARLTYFAIDAIRAAADTLIDEYCKDQLGCVPLRVGIHCGEVSGCIIGSQIPKYTIMGDAVNTASRMESTGLPGKVQCSAAMAAMISAQSDDFLSSPRKGGVSVKGKGHMDTFWVSFRWGLHRARAKSCPDIFISASQSSALETSSTPIFHQRRQLSLTSGKKVTD